MLGNKGIRVKVYEFRDDIRKTKVYKGRSINLTISGRGISALRLAGIDDDTLKKFTIPVRGRILHTQDGTRMPFPTDRKGRCCYSVTRKVLLETLIAVAEKNPNIQFFYKHKFLRCCFKTGKYQVQGPDGNVIDDSADLLIGCDGAHSAVREQMMNTSRFNYNQSYFKLGYIELCIPPTESGQFAMEPDYLHFWTEKKLLMTGMPNTDCTYTLTLIMPFEIFEQTNTPAKLLQLFRENFPDAIPLIGKEKLIADFFNASPNAMVTIKCNSYHVGDKVLIIGDAAHTMLPFNGQGMNSGFEDCEILSELLSTYNYNLREVLPAFSKCRQKDMEVLCDLSISAYHAMKLHTSQKFLLRNRLDEFLNRIFPKSWLLLNSEINFSKLQYAQCLARKQAQDKILSAFLWSVSIIGIFFTTAMVASF
ncbi:kynurenine 3-monooxygenase [Trichonephila inaurata madagascariensis]|uniref:Kynurenine 3-monooxygenase n=1 Tax=Trichonephila inaurata madagascariensis TaxID=2747483 RepID=A0A8X7BP40_9ARAC|nr:kynurenine 3-monooxygenase [Trichonephila inaurata madagascariensis]